MSGFHLSRVRLLRDAPVAALAPLLLPEGSGARAAASHHLVWALFADSAERRRDFLWREEGPGRFLILSARPPANLDNLFEIESKPFEPSLAPGDVLGFTLHANPVIARFTGPGARGKREDVVMHALYRIPPGERAGCRPDIVAEAGRDWLIRQGAAHGFVPQGPLAVDGYETVRVPRAEGKPIRFGVLDISGVLKVEDPARFLGALTAGFGRARAFGCGLMLIRRAPRR